VPSTVGQEVEPVHGGMLPPINSRVLIHLASQDAWVPHTVIGYYAWADHGGDKRLHRVFVRVRDAGGYENSRLLCDVRPAPPQAAPEQEGKSYEPDHHEMEAGAAGSWAPQIEPEHKSHEEGMLMAGDLASELGKLMRSQYRNRNTVVPDGNNEAGRNMLQSAPTKPDAEAKE